MKTKDRYGEVDPLLNAIASDVVDASYKVYSELGPGLLESACEVCLVHSLSKRGRKVARQVSMPVEFDGIRLDAGYRIDLLVDERLVVEIEAVDSILPVHMAQVITYLKLLKQPPGLAG